MSSTPPTDDDKAFMRLALELAAKGAGYVEPNPMVGCVLVAGNAVVGREVIGSGYHRRFGGPHAERDALADACRNQQAARLAGSTAYVTLEPCCHFGKTPPCTDALLEAQVARVVVAMLDPFDQVAGRGVNLLRKAGVRVDVGVMEADAAELNAPYLKRLRKGRPWVIGKWAMSLDGKTATRTGHSQWISGQASRAVVHELRGRVDAIVVGSGTALADDPLLTARSAEPPPRKPLRVVVDSNLKLPVSSQLVRTVPTHPTLLWCGPAASQESIHELRTHGCLVEQSTEPDPNGRLERLLEFLVSEHRATNILIEGGGQLMGSLLDIGELDETWAFIAPRLIGGSQAPPAMAGAGFAKVGDGPRLRTIEQQVLEEDVLVRCRWDW